MSVRDPVIAEQECADDFTIEQRWEEYTPQQHALWDRLYTQQIKTLKNRAAQEFYHGLKILDLNKEGIPDFHRVNQALRKLTGWEVVAVPGLVPDAVFFEHLANRRFPAGRFIREPHEIDYIEEPDIFHDVFGHVPLLSQPVFAAYMQAYGENGLRTIKTGGLKNLARLYWYTVEFGLIRHEKELRIYGAGIVSSRTESIFSLESSSPHRIHFDLERLMKTDYRIDDFQQTYFVIDSYDELFEATHHDLSPLCARLEESNTYRVDEILPGDTVFQKGTQAYALAGGRLADEAV